MLLRRATIGEIVREDGVFRAELRSGQQALNVPKGRVYSALCDAGLGDARCGVDLEDPAFRGDGARDGGAGPASAWRSMGSVGSTTGWFGFGRAAWGIGRARAGLRDRVVSHARVGGDDILALRGAGGRLGGRGR